MALFLIILFEISFVQNPRKQQENGCRLVVLGCMYLFILISAIAAIYTVVGIAVDLKNICISIAFVDAFLVGRIIKKKKVAELEWFKEDILSHLILIIAIIGISIWRFGIKLQLVYGDVDASRYMQGAMQILYDKKISGQYFTTLIQAMFIDVCRDFLLPISYYKALILSHIIMQIMGISMFYILLSVINDKRQWRWINLWATIFFWCGFPLYYSIVGTFIQSMNGATIVMVLLYYTIRLQKRTINAVQGIMGLISGGFGLLVCYPFFGLIIVVMIMPEAILWSKKNFFLLTRKAKTFLCCSFLGITGIGSLFAAQRVGNSIQTLIIALQAEGSIYKSPYKDFIFFVPVLIVYIVGQWKKSQECKTILRMNLMAIVFACIWFGLYINGYLSSYYYYRMYYILWMMAWLMVIDVIRIFREFGQDIVIVAYSVFWAVMVTISVVDLNEKLWEVKPELFAEKENGQVICPLYKLNYETAIRESTPIFSEQEFHLYNYVMEDLSEHKVFMIHSNYTAIQAEWFLGITYSGQETANEKCNLDLETMEQVLVYLDYNDVDYVLIYKNDPICMQYFTRVFGKAQIVYENDMGYILKRENQNWTSLIYDLKDKDNGLFMIYSYISNNYNMSSVPIICETELMDQAFEYSVYAGLDAIKYVGTMSPEDFTTYTYIFNIDEVQYMLILKNSQMYQQNKEYFDSQIIVRETDEGMIIQHAGDGWMPSEQE